jgi:peroxiredoxin
VRSVCVLGVLCALAATAADNSRVPEIAARLDLDAGKTTEPLAVEFRMRSAQILQDRYPGLAREFLRRSLDQLRTSKDGRALGPAFLQALTAVSPSDVTAVLPLVPDIGGRAVEFLLAAHHTDMAAEVYRYQLAHKNLDLQAKLLLERLALEKPAEARKLFQEMVAALPSERLDDAYDAWQLLKCAGAVRNVAPETVSDVADRLAEAASAPNYGEKGRFKVTAEFRVGSTSLTTDNSRDTILIFSGSLLRALAPDRFQKRKSLFARWDLAGPLSVPNETYSMNQPRPASAATVKTRPVSEMTAEEREKMVAEAARNISRQRTEAARVSQARNLYAISKEQDLGAAALKIVAGALGDALRGTDGNGDGWLDLAGLVYARRVPAPFDHPALLLAIDFLALRESLGQEVALPGLDSKSYSLAALRGRIVLLDFWATWCGPCRKEMPDMEKLYRNWERKGLTVLAVSDEPRDTVAPFIAKQGFTFPVLLDPGRKLFTLFNVVGIPHNFIFDREGKLIAQTMDTSTEEQFLEMLKKAGLE